MEYFVDHHTIYMLILDRRTVIGCATFMFNNKRKYNDFLCKDYQMYDHN